MIVYFSYSDFEWKWRQVYQGLVSKQLLANWRREAQEYMQNHEEYKDKKWQEVYMRVNAIDYLSWKDDPSYDFVAGLEDWALEKAREVLIDGLKDGQWEVNI